MEYKDYYAVLGVKRDATTDEIKKSYRRLARKFHPDVSKEKNAEEQFKNVQEAYEVLKDKEKRAAYDQLGADWKAGQAFRKPPNWQRGHHFSAENAGDFRGEDLGGFSDFFADLFGGAHVRGRSQGFRQRGADEHAKIAVTLEDAFHGTVKTVQMQIQTVTEMGQIAADNKKLKITIPKGAEQGQQLRLAGQGSSGLGGGPAGDLYLEIDISPHPYFTLSEKDIYLTLPVAPWEAALGAAINVPTLAGFVELKLKPGSEASQKLRLKGRGLPGHPSGDQYVILKIVIPQPKNEAERALYQQMSTLMAFNPRQQWVK